MSNIPKLTIKELLSKDSYRIPIYQRNYDWGERQVLQLIEDIADYAKESDNGSDKRVHNYYLGTIVVYPRTEGSKTYYETVDGQQRLMTLTILLNVLKQKEVKDKKDWEWYHGPNMEFEHRDRDNEAIRLMAEGKLMNDVFENTTNIRAVYRIIDKAVENLNDREKFLEFFLEKVLVFRVPIPKGTNLNHYFEIMNSRGEQLEKHEYLKAKLMDLLNKNNDDERCLFNEIWEACSNMNKYVQMNMRVKLREIIFTKSWNDYQDNDFDTLLTRFNEPKQAEQQIEQQIENQGPTERSIMQLFTDAQNHVDYPQPKDEEDQSGDGKYRFGSVIGFPNFLLHVLKIMYHNEINKDVDVDNEIKLDDKRLIEIFKTVIDSYKDDVKQCEFAKKFIIALLKLRYLFDLYIIKREHIGERENWSLKRLKKSSTTTYVKTFGKGDDDDNETEDEHSKEIRMLEAMFHVSAPTQIYKHWMSAALMYLHNQEQPINAEDYFNYLWRLSKAYMLDRYLAADGKKLSFEEIIYSNEGKSQNSIGDIYWGNINIEEYPHVGEHVENFVFNFYDFLLYNQNHDNDFEFTYRTSVEHFYPQHPTDREPMDFDHLHSFGNLCLVSRGMNSKFTNNLPGAKAENFGSIDAMKSYSIKLKSMINCVKNHEIWDEQKISQKENEAKELIIKMLSANNNSL